MKFSIKNVLYYIAFVTSIILVYGIYDYIMNKPLVETFDFDRGNILDVYTKYNIKIDTKKETLTKGNKTISYANKFNSIIVKENEHLFASYDDQHLFASYDEILFDNFPFTSISTTLEKKTEKNYKIKNRKDFVENDEPSLFVYILRGVLLFSILGFGLFFLIRAWWRGWKDNIRWVKILTYIVSILVALWIIIGAAVYFIFRNYGFG